MAKISRKAFISGVTAFYIATTPVPAAGLEPLSTLAVSVGTSLVVKGINWLFGKAVQAPDVHLEETRQIHAELREVHRDVLANRDLQIRIHRREGFEHDETRRTILEAEERIKNYIKSTHEQGRIIKVLTGVTVTANLSETVQKATDNNEKLKGANQLYRAAYELEKNSYTLDYGESLRAAMVLPRIAAIRAQWIAFSLLPNLKQHKIDFISRSGAWLAKQRKNTGSINPVTMTLGDIIINFEAHLLGLDMYFGSLSDPCSPLWNGYLSIETATTTDDYITIKKIRVSQLRLRVEPNDLSTDTTDDAIRFANNPSIQPTELDWSYTIKNLPEPIKWKKSTAGVQLANQLKRLHDDVFDCSARSLALARQRLAEAIPPLIDPRRGTPGISVQPISYDAAVDRAGTVLLTIERLLERQSCEHDKDCRRHWEFEHMRREIIAATLSTLYAIRIEVNKTLEWLAEKTTGAQCTYFREDPRVCVFLTANIGKTLKSDSVENPALRKEDISVEVRNLGAYQITQKFMNTADSLAVATTQERHARQRLQREQVLGTMNRRLARRADYLGNMQREHNEYLKAVVEQAVRKAWMRFALSIVQDQILAVVEDYTEGVLTDWLGGAPVGGETLDGWEVAILDVLSKGSGNSKRVSTNVENVEGLRKAENNVLVAVAPMIATDTSKGSQPETGERAQLTPAERFSLKLPPVPPEIKDFSAGLGDNVSLGLTKLVRQWTGLSAEVNMNTRSYRNGTLAGTGALAGTGVVGLSKVAMTALKAGKAGAALTRLGNFSLFMRLKGSTSTISIINHAIKGKNSRIIALDVPTNWGGGGRIVTKLPHVHIGRWKAHLPWEPKWLLPTAGSVWAGAKAYRLLKGKKKTEK